MDWHDRITVDPKVLVGKPVIKGTRIAVEFVMELLGRGWTVEQILQRVRPSDAGGHSGLPVLRQRCAEIGTGLSAADVKNRAMRLPRQRERHRDGDSGIAATGA